MKKNINIAELINYDNINDFKNIDTAVDALIALFSDNIVKNDPAFIDEISEKLLPFQISRMYEALNIEANPELLKVFYLGILQSFYIISKNTSNKLRYYKEISHELNDEKLLKIIEVLFNGPILCTSLIEKTCTSKDIIKKYMQSDFLDTISIAGNKMYILTKKGMDAYEVAKLYSFNYINTSNDLFIELLDNIADAIPLLEHSNKSEVIKNIMNKSRYIDKYDHVTNHRIRVRLNKLLNNIDEKKSMYISYEPSLSPKQISDVWHDMTVK